MDVEARKRTFEEFFAPLADRLGFKFTPDTELKDFLLEQEALIERRFGSPFCPCQLRTGERARDMRIVCPCIPFHRFHFDLMRRCWCGLFVHKDVTDPDSLPQVPLTETERR